jgi:transposase
MPKPKNGPSEKTESVEVVAPARKRRDFAPAEKLRIVRAANACTGRGEVEALLRREGVYSSLLSAWRRSLEAHGALGLGKRKPGRKAKRDAKDVRVEELEKKLARAEKELGVVHQLLALQKKVSELLGVTLPPSVEP